MGFCVLNKPLSQQSESARNLDLSPLGTTDDSAEQSQYKIHIAAYKIMLILPRSLLACIKQ